MRTRRGSALIMFLLGLGDDYARADGLRWTSRQFPSAPAAWRGGPGELVASEDVGGAAGPGTGRAGLAMLLSAERLVGESSLDDAGAGDKARRRAETDATLEDEHERQKRQQRTCIRNTVD